MRVKKLIKSQQLKTHSTAINNREGNIRELIKIQSTYVANLGYLIQYYLIPLRAYFVTWCGTEVDPQGWVNLEYNFLFNATEDLQKCHTLALSALENAIDDESMIAKAFEIILSRYDACSR